MTVMGVSSNSPFFDSVIIPEMPCIFNRRSRFSVVLPDELWYTGFNKSCKSKFSGNTIIFSARDSGLLSHHRTAPHNRQFLALTLPFRSISTYRSVFHRKKAKAPGMGASFDFRFWCRERFILARPFMYFCLPYSEAQYPGCPNSYTGSLSEESQGIFL